MLERFARAITRFSTERPWTVLALFAVLLGVGIAGASRLEMRLNYLELLPENDVAVKDLRFVMKKAGSEGYLITGVTGGTREQRMAFAKEWTQLLSQRSDLRYAEYHYDVSFFRKHAKSLLPLKTLQELREKLDQRVKGTVEKQFDLGFDDEPASQVAEAKPPSQPADEDLEKTIASYEKQIPSEYIEDKAQTELFVLAKPALETSDVQNITNVLETLRAEADRLLPRYPGITADFGGPMVFQKAFDTGVRGDIGRISFWALALSSFFLLLATRRPVASGLILLPVVIAISVTLALAAVTVGHLTIISGLLVAVLLGLGVEFGIHLVLRTAEARGHSELREALLEAAPETMSGAFSGAITNGAAFLVLVLCDFKAFREFGAIAAMGVVLSWLFTYTLLPAVILIIERRFPGWIIRRGAGSDKPLLVPRWLILAIVSIVPIFGVLGIYAFPKVRIERSFAALHEKHPDPVGLRAGAAMNASLTPAICWLPSIADAKRFEEVLDELRANDPRHALGNSVSLARVVHDDWDKRQPELDRIKLQMSRLPAATREKYKTRLDEVQAMLDAPRIGVEQLPLEFRRKLTPLDGHGTLLLLGPGVSLDDADDLDLFVQRTEQALAEAEKRGITVHAMSENRIAVRIFRQVFADAPFIAWSATLVALLTLFLLIRSVKQTLLVFTPIALGMLCMCFGLYVYGVKLNFINMAVIPSIFTVAIDNTVHLYHRYREEGRDAMPTILRHTGAAVFIATCVNASGYGPTLLAKFYGLKSLGLLATFGMAGMIASTVLWFPALLMLLPKQK